MHDDFNRDNVEFFRGFTVDFNELTAAARTLLIFWANIMNDFFARNLFRKRLASADFTLMRFDFPEFIRRFFFSLQQNFSFVKQALRLRWQALALTTEFQIFEVRNKIAEFFVLRRFPLQFISLRLDIILRSGW